MPFDTEVIAFLDRSPSVYHAVDNMVTRLRRRDSPI